MELDDEYKLECKFDICDDFIKTLKESLNELNVTNYNEEENEMFNNEILNIYYDRRVEEYMKENEENIDSLEEKDIFTKLDKEYNNKLQKLLEKECKEKKTYFKTDYLTKETEMKIQQEEDKFTEKVNTLKKMLKEVDVLLDMAETYEDKKEILSNYNILNHGKLFTDRRLCMSDLLGEKGVADNEM